VFKTNTFPAKINRCAIDDLVRRTEHVAGKTLAMSAMSTPKLVLQMRTHCEVCQEVMLGDVL
jgi:hypothetical protein